MAKELITEDNYWQVLINRSNQTLQVTWLPQVMSLDEDVFMTYLGQWAKFVATFQPKGFIVDARLGHVIMSPDVQQWHDETIVPVYVEQGITKIAFVLPKDIFASVSLDQAFSEDNASKKLETIFFNDFDEAEEWLIQAMKAISSHS